MLEFAVCSLHHPAKDKKGYIVHQLMCADLILGLVSLIIIIGWLLCIDLCIIMCHTFCLVSFDLNKVPSLGVSVCLSVCTLYII